MKVRVTKVFADKFTGRVHKVGKELFMEDEERIAKIVEGGYGIVVPETEEDFGGDGTAPLPDGYQEQTEGKPSTPTAKGRKANKK